MVRTNPIGVRVYALFSQPWEIVGIVKDTRLDALDREPYPQFYVDLRQLPGFPFDEFRPQFAVRTTGSVSVLTTNLRDIVRQIEPRASVENVTTVDDIVWSSISRPRLYTVFIALFAVVALVMAATGIFGLMAYVVQHRTREIGVRMSGDEARYAARRAMGSVALARDRHRDARSFRWLADLRRDLVHIRRGLLRTPIFTTVAVLTVALGVGANVAIFGVVYQTLVKPLPFDAPDRLVTVATSVPKLASRFPLLPVAANDFLEYQRSNTVFADLCALQGRDFNLTGTGEPERLHGAVVSRRFFPMLGVRPERGRHFAPDEEVEGRDAVVIISHALWERRFGSDPAIVGRSILLDGHPHAIVGVMAPPNIRRRCIVGHMACVGRC